jgi:putative acetyltransferase
MSSQMQHLKFRLAKKIDLDEIQKLFMETIKATCSKDYSDEQIGIWVESVKNKERWFGFIEKQYFLLAELDQIIVGFASLENRNPAYLNLMFVHKDYLRLGIAGELLNAIEIEKSGGVDLESDVSVTAKAFFEKKGFRVQKENRNKKPNGIELINYRMLKEYNQS